jgi:hypothetical protein
MTSEQIILFSEMQKKLENNIKHMIQRCAIEKEIFHNSNFNSNLP